jgi:hypothetical protein
MLNYMSKVIEAGQQPSKWAGEEMESALDMLRQVSLAAVGDHQAISAEFPYFNLTSLLQVNAAHRQGDFGNGLLIALRLPYSADREILAHVAALTNLLELEQRPFGHFRGGWCVSTENELAFKAFYPNIVGQHGLAANLMLQMAGRAEWFATINDKRSREERWKTACPAFLRVLEARD